MALTAIRLVVAGSTALSPDEAYYWTWSRVLAPGYLDHPPMVALWTRAGTELLGQGSLGIRLFGPLSAALGSILLAAAAEDLFPGRRLGIPAAALFNATLLMGVGSITMTPDTPLLFFWTAALWGMGRLIRTGRPGWWLLTGAAAGGALDSKYTAVFLGAGLALWLIGDPTGRRWLRTPWPWLGGLIAGLCFLPVVGWNASHDWVSFAKQGGRTGDWHPADALRFLGELIGGQIGIATPFIAILCAAGVWQALRQARRDSVAGLLAALTIPGVAVFLQHALGDRVQANWPAVLYPAACIAAVAYAGRFWRPAAALGYGLTAVLYVQAAASPFAIPRKFDVTLMRLGGWGPMVQAVAAQQATFVATDNYGIASVLAHGLPGPVVGTEPRWDLFGLPNAGIAGQTGLLVRSARRADPPAPAPWRSITPAGTIIRSRNGVVAETYELYRVVAATDMVRLPSAR